MGFLGVFRACVIGLAGLSAVACQSSKVASFEKNHDIGPGNTVTVEPFDISQVVWTGDQGEHRPEEIQWALRDDLVQALRAEGMQVQDDSGVSISGAIELVDAGSGSSRLWWGFGAGQSKLVCRVELYDAAVSRTLPAYTLRVEGGSRGRGGFFAGGYMGLGDARDAAEQIARFLKEKRAGNQAAEGR